MKSLLRARLTAEVLEPREVPATITVTTDADGPPDANQPVTLREAMYAIRSAWLDRGTALGADLVTLGVKATKGPNTINFAIPGLGVHRITLAAAQGNLPPLIGPVVIDGYSQKSIPPNGGRPEADAKVNSSTTGFNGQIRIEIDGYQVFSAVENPSTGFQFKALKAIDGFAPDVVAKSVPQGVIKGLSVFGFETAFNISDAGGRMPDGKIAVLQIAGNLIGLSASGTIPKVPDRITGAEVDAFTGFGIRSSKQAEAVIGGYGLADRNVIARANIDGIRIVNQFTPNARSVDNEDGEEFDNRRISIVNNLIGTTIKGDAAAEGNGVNGIHLINSYRVNIGGSLNPGVAPQWDPKTPFAGEFDPTKARGNVISGHLESNVVVEGGDDVEGAGVVIAGNYIGTNSTGTAATIGNNKHGVVLSNTELVHVGADGPRGNVISGNKLYGVMITRTPAENFGIPTENEVEGNWIGTDWSGTFKIPNGGGVLVYGPSFRDSIKENQIAGNVGDGITVAPIVVDGETLRPRGTQIKSNLVGLNSDFVGLGNGGNGISVSNTPFVWLDDNTVGANGKHGVVLQEGSDNALLSGNRIGVHYKTVPGGGPLKPIPVPNVSGGLLIKGSKNTNKNPDPGTGLKENVIAFNGGPGIEITGAESTGNTITDTLVLGNAGAGIVIDGGSFNDFSTATGGPNKVTGNGGAGVAVLSGTNNQFLGSLFYANAGIGIDLGNDGPTANDAHDHASGPNRWQNKPVITTAADPDNPFSLITTVTLTEAVRPNTGYRIGIYSNSPGAQNYLGYIDVTTDSSGTATFTLSTSLIGTASVDSISLLAAVREGNSLFLGDTSEFSDSATYTPPVVPPLTVTADEGSPVTVTVLPNSTVTLLGTSDGLFGTTVINADNTITYTPYLNWNGTDTFTYVVIDMYGLYSLATVTVTVNPVNTAPVATSGSVTTLLDTPVSIDLWTLADDAETDVADLTFEVSGATNGTVVLLADGHTAQFTPASGFTGAASFTYTATDTGDGDSPPLTSDAAVVSVAVVPPASIDVGLFWDLDGDGEQGPDETAVSPSGTDIWLIDVNDNVVGEFQPGTTGWSRDGLLPGDYRLYVVPAPGILLPANGLDVYGYSAYFSVGTGASVTLAYGLVDAAAPVVTDGYLWITGGTGPDGAFQIGDTVTATWDNTAAGDDNPDIDGVTFDFSQFGGPSAVAATNTNGVWTATYTLLAGVSNTSGNVSATATDLAGNGTTAADTTIDLVGPTAVFEQVFDAIGQGGTVPVLFTVTFSEPVTGFTAADVVLSGTAPGTRTAELTGSGATYILTVNGVTGPGTVRAAFATGAAKDLAHNDSAAAQGTLEITVADWYGQFQLASSTYTTSEGVGTFAVTVTRTAGSNGTVSVPFTVTAGTATAADFATITTGPLSFAQDVTSRTITFSVVDDGSGEASENFAVALGAPSDGASGSVTASTVTITDPVLGLTSLTATASGVILAFNRDFDPTQLNLYDSSAGALGAADVTLTGATVGTVRGSLVVQGNQLNFVKTGGALAADTYTVAVRSASNGLTDLAGALLDGDASGTAGGNFSGTVTVASSTALVLSLPDFARGYGQPVNVPATGTGLPLRISDAAGVTSAEADLLFDPTLLTISTGTFTSGQPFGGTLTVTAITGGVRLSVTGLTGATGTDVAVANLTASVPTTAPYAAKHALGVAHVVVNGGAVAAVGEDAVHVAAYLGDTSGNQGLASDDTVLVSRLSTGYNGTTGFAAYRSADPRLLADFNLDGAVNSADSLLLSRKNAGLSVPQIPDIPAGVTPAAQIGPDPRLYFGSASAAAGQTATVVLRMSVAEPGGITGVTSLDVAARFDPTRFQVANIRFAPNSPFALAGWVLIANVDDATGTVRVAAFAPTGEGLSFAYGYDDDAILFDFTVRADAPSGASSLNLAESVGATRTAVNAGGFTLLPAPTDEDDDSVDGVFTVL